jgi:iron complex transport system ATP-binding protein
MTLAQDASANGVPPALVMRGVRVWAIADTGEAAAGAAGDPPARVEILNGIDWRVGAGEQWAVLGPNGAGKSTMLRLAGGGRHPSAGTVDILGLRVGRTDLRALRAGIGLVDGATAAVLPGWLAVRDVVLTGATGTIQPDWDAYGEPERARAAELLELVGCTRLAGRRLERCSTGERQRVQLARALMPAPRLLLLDEPASGLDLPAREAMLAALTGLAEREAPATVTVTHHLEEIPASVTHALLLRAGLVVASGPVGEVLTGGHLSACFDMPVEVGRRDGRWAAWAPARWR